MAHASPSEDLNREKVLIERLRSLEAEQKKTLEDLRTAIDALLQPQRWAIERTAILACVPSPEVLEEVRRHLERSDFAASEAVIAWFNIVERSNVEGLRTGPLDPIAATIAAVQKIVAENPARGTPLELGSHTLLEEVRRLVNRDDAKGG